MNYTFGSALLAGGSSSALLQKIQAVLVAAVELLAKEELEPLVASSQHPKAPLPLLLPLASLQLALRLALLLVALPLLHGFFESTTLLPPWSHTSQAHRHLSPEQAQDRG
jgi:hypothetical protein